MLIILTIVGCFSSGPPGAVSDMSAVANVSHVVVSWRAPFTLDVTGVEFDVTYSLLISNVTDQSQPPRDVACDLCHNLTLPQFTFSPPHPLPGHSFTFTVTPLNGAGRGPSSPTLTATLHDLTSTLTSLFTATLTDGTFYYNYAF